MPILPSLVSDFPAWLPSDAAARFGSAFDVEGRLPQAIDTLVGLAGKDVLLLDDPSDGVRARQLRARGCRLVTMTGDRASGTAAADVAIGYWSALERPGSPLEVAATGALRPGGRLLAIHEYGRDDLARWSARSSEPETDNRDRARVESTFLAVGWRIRVVHCRWTFEDLDAARSFASALPGGSTAAPLVTRARVSHNLALLYRAMGAER
jgi:hypothetical protein